jgi:hypothetical protein
MMDTTADSIDVKNFFFYIPLLIQYIQIENYLTDAKLIQRY